MRHKHSFNLIMAISADGFVATGPADDMRWTGYTDKNVFRMLTLSYPILLAGRVTAAQLPPLPGRQVFPLSRDPEKGMSLEEASRNMPGAWLIGGLDVALAALDADLVSTTFLCHTTARLGGGISGSPLIERLQQHKRRHNLVIDLTSTVEIFQHGP